MYWAVSQQWRVSAVAVARVFRYLRTRDDKGQKGKLRKISRKKKREAPDRRIAHCCLRSICRGGVTVVGCVAGGCGGGSVAVAEEDILKIQHTEL